MSRLQTLLQDTDPMPFGKYKGTAMQDVPANYLHWLWVNLAALQQEYSDGIWV